MARRPVNQTQPGGAKHVPSAVPIRGVGPSNAAPQVQSYRGDNEGPTTVGVNPNPPAQRLASDNNSLTSGTPAASTESTSFPPYGGNY